MALAVTTTVLALILLAAAGVAAFRQQRRISALAALLLGALALVAIDPKLPGAAPTRLRILVIDASRSFQPAHARLAEALGSAADDLSPRDRVAVVLAGARPELVLAPSAPERLAPALAEVRPALSSVSDLAGGVRAAAALVPDAGKDSAAAELLLVSDGLETRGSLADAALALRARGLRLDAWCPPMPVDRRARIVSLSGPGRASPGDRIVLQARVACPTEDPVTLQVRAVNDEGERLAGAALTVSGPVGERRARLELPGLTPGLWTMTAQLEGEDERRDEAGSAGRRWAVLVSEPEALLAIHIGAATRALLRSAGRPFVELDSKALTAPRLKAALAADPVGILIEDRPPAALIPLVEALAGRVEAGCRLIWLAGESGLRCEDAGAVAPLLALVEDPPRDPSRAVWLSLAVDASASMKERYPAAVRAGLAAAQTLLEERDRLALTAFAREARFRREPAPAEALERALGELLRLEPRGGTDIFIAMNAILDDFARAPEGSDRVGVICTDAEVELDPAPLARLEARIKGLRVDRARPAHVVFLLLDGERGQGAIALEPLRARLDRPGWSSRIVAAGDVTDALPKLLRGAVRRSRDRFAEGPLAVQTRDAGVARGFARRPGLVGRALRCRVAPGAEALAELSGEVGPLLARKSLGAGEVITCASDGAALASLAVKPEGRAWLAQMLGGAAGDEAGLRLSPGAGARVWTLSRRPSGPWPALTAVWRRGDQERGLVVVPVSEREARIKLPRDHAGGRITVSAAGEVVAVAALTADDALELTGAEPDLARLARAAALTGGRLLDRPAGAAATSSGASRGAWQSSPAPAILAMLALIAWMLREAR